jgi:uncharacterized protein
VRTPFDLLVIFLLFLAQWRMGRRVLAFARPRLSAAGLHLLRAAMLIFLLLITIGFALSFSFLMNRFPLPARFSLLAGAAGQIWLFASSLGYLLYRSVRLAGEHLWRPSFNAARRNVLQATGGALMAAPFALVGYGAFIERLDFHVREVDVPVPDLPADLDGLRLAQLSDLHLSAFLSEKDLARVIDSANELRAHLALVTGDLITAAGDPLDACLRQLARLRADAGILGCLGNHEVYADVEDYTERQGARLGIRFLRSRAQPLRFGSGVLNVAGVDYQRRGPQESYLRGAERLVAPAACNLLLSHNPDVFPTAFAKGYQLTLAGHTHGGQVNVEILNQQVNAARFFTPFVYGLYRHAGASIYVTRGIGTIGVPARLGAPPEIALVRLRKA